MGHGFEIRKKLILKKLRTEGSVVVKDIAIELNTSETTIRRDLNLLDTQEQLQQVYGGAIPLEDGESFTQSFSISKRSTHKIDEKRAIGKCAAGFVNDNDIIYIDPGTTCWEMIPFLHELRNLTIISNSGRLVEYINEIGHHNIIQLGGKLRNKRLDMVGPLTQIGIEQLKGFKAFQGADGIDMDFGLSSVDDESAFIGKIICERARESFVLVDDSKFLNPPLLYKVIEVDRVDHIITNKPFSKSWQKKCKEVGVRVTVA